MGKWWLNYPWRVIQTNMREIDMEHLDAKRFVDDLLSFDCNTVMVNAAGVLASYPTRLEDHEQNEFLSGDSLMDLVELCHQNGIKVIARTDFSKIRQKVFERHPDWAYRTPEGEPVNNNGSYHACISAGFQNAYMDLILEEMLAEIPFDGVYCNMGGFMTVDYNCKLYPPCHCASCTGSFLERYGFQVPDKDLPCADINDPAVKSYQRYKQETVSAQRERIVNLIRKINPDIAFCSVDYLRQESNTEFGRGLPHWQYSASSNVRTMRGMGKPATNASVDFMGFSMRHTAVSPSLTELRLWQTIANYGGPDYFIMGRLDNQLDKSAHERVKKVFSFAKRHETLLQQAHSQAEVLLVRDSYNIPNPEERGWVRALTELHIPFDEVLASGLAHMDFSRYGIVILPMKPRLNGQTAGKIDKFAEDGGIVLASGPVPMSEDGPLQCLGVKPAGPKDSKALGAALKCRASERADFPSLELRGPIPVGETYYPVTVSGSSRAYLRLLPPQPFGPPEVCYPHEAPTEFHGLISHPFGKGRGVLVPWSPGACYYLEGHDIWRLFLRDVLMVHCGAVSLSEVLTPMVEVTRGRSGDMQLINLVNGSGHSGNSFHDPLPVHDVELRLPWRGDCPRCDSLFTPNNASCRLDGSYLAVTVKRLDFFECVTLQA